MAKLDDEQKKEIQGMFAELLGGDAFKAALTGTFSEALKPINLELGKLKEAQAKPPEKPAEKPPEKPEGGTAKPDKSNEALQALERQMESLKQQLVERDRQAAIARRDDAVRGALLKSGADATGVDFVLAHLERSGAYVERDGSFSMKGRDKYGNEIEQSLEEGAKAFLGTDVGKRFLPPTNAQGTGGSVNGTPTRGPVTDVNELRRSLQGLGLMSAPAANTTH